MNQHFGKQLQNLDLSIIGNCQISALLNKEALIQWACLPAFDSVPVFDQLVDLQENSDSAQGFWGIELSDFDYAEQSYEPATAIVITKLYDKSSQCIKVTDFVPRLPLEDGDQVTYKRPPVICRIVEAESGQPSYKMKLRPRQGYGEQVPEISHEQGTVSYKFVEDDYTLQTNAAADSVVAEKAMSLGAAHHYVFGQTKEVQALETDVPVLLAETKWSWAHFIADMDIPQDTYNNVARAAITLKLCSYEETGAIIAAMTTSIPESADSERNWDYRYCWLRDALFVVQTLHRLGHSQTMEDYMGYLMSLDVFDDDKDFQPLYGIRGETHIEEWIAEGLGGYRGMGPVRIGNQAYVQQQNDVWGAALLAVAPLFSDGRFAHIANEDSFRKLEKFGHSAAESFDQSDAGIWEFRSFGRIHTFSAVMCWAACDALAQMAENLDLYDRRKYWRSVADDMRSVIFLRAWNKDMNSFVEPFESGELDASLLLLPYLGFIDAKDPHFLGTLEAIGKQLRHKDLLFRYVVEDDFGKPDVAFTVCAFWYMDALAASGNTEEARQLYEKILKCCNHVGILSEDIDFETHELWGNFPQTYSMVGLIQLALRLSEKHG